MKIKRAYIKLLFAASVITPLLSVGNVFASSLNYNNLMSDSVLDNYGSMSASQIDSFLNSFSGSCISTNAGFSAPAPTGYNPTNGFLYGSNSSAGTVIYDAAQAYQINPQVLISMLQAQKSLVTGGGSEGCSTLAYAGAMGYDCPDSVTSNSYSGVDLYSLHGNEVSSVTGTCVDKSAAAGFSQQTIRAAWLLKFDRERAEGNTSWAIINGSWDNTDDISSASCYEGYMVSGTYARCPGGATTYYDGTSSIDNTSVQISDGATAALYDYTPHLNGNSEYNTIYTSWFGSTVTSNEPYSWTQGGNLGSYANSSMTEAYTNGIYVQPGQQAYLQVLATNTGYEDWSPSTVHLGLASSTGNVAMNNNTWYNTNRIAMTSTNPILPGQTATYDFSVTAPQTPGDYTISFNMVDDGVTGIIGNPNISFVINVVSPVTTSSTATTLASGQTISPGKYILSPDGQSMLTYQKDGNAVLYNDFQPVWASNTAGTSPGKLIMQTDGNLVIYNSANTAVWASGTNGNSGAYFDLQTDGNGVIYNSSLSPLWASNTVSVPMNPDKADYSMSAGETIWPGQSLNTDSKSYDLMMQDDGNLVLYNSAGKALWATGTNGIGAVYASFQSDGNLVVYNQAGRALWASNTNAESGTRLLLQDDGNLVIYTPNGTPLWATGTN